MTIRKRLMRATSGFFVGLMSGLAKPATPQPKPQYSYEQERQRWELRQSRKWRFDFVASILVIAGAIIGLMDSLGLVGSLILLFFMLAA